MRTGTLTATLNKQKIKQDNRNDSVSGGTETVRRCVGFKSYHDVAHCWMLVKCTTHLHVGVICRVEVLAERIGARPFTAVSVVLFREDDPGAPSDLVEVDMHVHSPAEVFLLVLFLSVVLVVLAATLLPLDSSQHLTLCTQEEFGALGCTQETGLILLSVL